MKNAFVRVGLVGNPPARKDYIMDSLVVPVEE